MSGLLPHQTKGNEMDMLKEIERIEALAENKRDSVKLANFWKMYALEMRDEKNAEIQKLQTDLQNWKDFCKKVQRQQIAEQPNVDVLVEALKHADEFIRNGVEFGYIRMPDDDLKGIDSAHDTPKIIAKALATYQSKNEKELVVSLFDGKFTQEDDELCESCNGTGKIFIGRSGLECDGNAPEFEDCDCANAIQSHSGGEAVGFISEYEAKSYAARVKYLSDKKPSNFEANRIMMHKTMSQTLPLFTYNPDQSARIKSLESEIKKLEVILRDRDSEIEIEYANVIELQATNAKLVEAAQELVERWDSPKWKEQEHTGVFIDRLRMAIPKAGD